MKKLMKLLLVAILIGVGTCCYAEESVKLVNRAALHKVGDKHLCLNIVYSINTNNTSIVWSMEHLFYDVIFKEFYHKYPTAQEWIDKQDMIFEELKGAVFKKVEERIIPQMDDFKLEIIKMEYEYTKLL